MNYILFSFIFEKTHKGIPIHSIFQGESNNACPTLYERSADSSSVINKRNININIILNERINTKINLHV